MPELRHRQRFQIHLLTAIVMMFVAGGLIWANAVVTESHKEYETPRVINEYGVLSQPYSIKYENFRYGWPAMAYECWDDYKFAREAAYYLPTSFHIDYTLLSIDVSTALLILFAVWFLCEWLIRRRAARKGA